MERTIALYCEEKCATEPEHPHYDGGKPLIVGKLSSKRTTPAGGGEVFRHGFPPIAISLRNRNDQDPRCFAAFELRDANGVLPEQILEDTGWIVASRQVNHLRRPTSARRDLQKSASAVTIVCPCSRAQSQMTPSSTCCSWTWRTCRRPGNKEPKRRTSLGERFSSNSTNQPECWRPSSAAKR